MIQDFGTICEVQVGLDGTQHLRFQQELAQVQAVDRIALQDLHDRRGRGDA